MTNSITRIVAILRADFLVRFRRFSTMVVFLLLSAFAYVWIPSPATGRTLIQINGQRAIYNSGALGMGTASLGMIFVGLFGFYVISNAITRDIVSRCGLVAAATPMRSIEYLLGKFLGNLVFLATFLCGFMLFSMAMLLVRGEARLEPWTFVQQYLLLTPAAIVLVSAVAVLFESIPWLSGKFGDVFYFFLWMGLTGAVVANEANGGRWSWVRYMDSPGVGFMISQMQHTLHTDSVSIGASTFDPAKPTVVFNGLFLTRDWIAPRIVSTLLPLALLPVAAFFFHRFDPVRLGPSAGKTSRTWIGKFWSLAKPLSRRVVRALTIPSRRPSFGAAIWSDAVLTLTLSPLALLTFVGVTIMSLAGTEMLPFVFAILAIVIADISSRDTHAGTIANLYAVPRLRENFVWWKFAATLVFSLIFCAVAILVAAIRHPDRLSALLVGIIFVVSLATMLGTVSGNSKAFIVAFLSFWYLVVNDKGQTRILDFAGLYGRSTSQTMLIYLAVSVGAIFLANIAYRTRLARA
jgi:hypothetical protein